MHTFGGAKDSPLIMPAHTRLYLLGGSDSSDARSEELGGEHGATYQAAAGAPHHPPRPNRRRLGDASSRHRESWADYSGVQWHQLFFSFLFGGCPTKNGLPKEGFPLFSEGH